MIEISFPTPREHFLSVAISKHVFQHPKRGVVFVRDPITLSHAQEFQLTPIILYAVSVASTTIRWLTFSPENAAQSLCAVLNQAWSTAPGLRGPPDVLKISRQLSTASQRFGDALREIDVRLEIADGKDRRFSAALRNAQAEVLMLGWLANDAKTLKSIEALRAFADERHKRDFEHAIQYPTAAADAANRMIFELPARNLKGSLPTSLSWSAGDWLSSWQTSLPPKSPRYFHETGGISWLLDVRPDNDDDDNEELADDDVASSTIDWAFEKAKLVLNCWPNKLVDVAQTIGVTLRQLKWYLSQHSPLEYGARSSLLSLVGVTTDYEGYYEATGPCVLVASSLRNTIAIYDELSHGGDLDFSLEALPTKAYPDPSWRYLIFRSCGGHVNIIMLARGSDAAVRLDKDQFINFCGSVNLPDDVYRSIVSTCARACVEPMANRPAVEDFEQRHIDFLDSLEDQFERY